MKTIKTTNNKNLRIGEFIAEKLAISKGELKKFLNMQEYLSDKIGEIAVREGFINKKELDEILNFQKKHRIIFGNAALYLGYLKNLQIKYLLDVQAQNKYRIGELLVEQGIVSQNKFLKILNEFYIKKQIQFTILALTRNSYFKEVEEIAKTFTYRFHSCANEKEMFMQVKKLNPQLIFLDQEMEEVMEHALNIRQAALPNQLKIALLIAGKQRLEMLSGYDYGIDYILPVPLDTKHLINIIIDTEIKSGEKRKERILIADDSPIARKSITEELDKAGFQILFAENGKLAVEIATLELPDLITMDINMPVMDGYQACLELKNQKITSQIPIIILTGNNSREEREKGFEVGAVEYFTKPFTRGHLSSYIKYLLSGRKKIRPERILIAEDSPICRNIYETIFNKYGFRCELAENGQKLLNILEKGFEPSAILLDCYMPVMDGFQTCSRLKGNEKYRHIPVIMVTAAINKEDILKGLKTGADDYIVKPFDGDELIARIEAHVKNFTFVKKLQEQYKQLDKVTKELRVANKKLERLAIIDPLTELLNRRGFDKVLSTESKKIQRNGTELVAVLIDLDDFKNINDSLGHSAGDMVLKEIAKKIKDSLRPSDYISRIGGDEFMGLLTDASLAEGLKTAERIRFAISESPIKSQSQDINITASLGVTKVDRTSLSTDKLLSQTHLALHKCKESGKNRVINADE